MRSALITSILVAVAFLTSACNTQCKVQVKIYRQPVKNLKIRQKAISLKKVAAVLTAQLTK
ncbi:hypothetical protein RPATATE_0368 [Rickettsia parkeri str. Tate's Hell]|uniref:Lipoprotein n=1 Tax=Rickettsia parkeri str. Tate's Hell TaxID=1359189 RepID=A0ABR5DQJ1_RICPA|nr:hypothetical protein RPAAT24_0557 [Rickettsia parkeri str. AT\